MCCSQKLRRSIKSVDQFGQRIELNFDGKGMTHKTCCGGLFSILAFLLIIAVTVGQVFMHLREEGSLQGQVDYQVDFLKTGDIALKGEIGMYILANDLKQAKSIRDLGPSIDLSEMQKYINIQFIKRNATSGDVMEFEAVKCTKDHFNFTSDDNQGVGAAI